MPRTITVTADAKKKTAGTADPLFTYTITKGSLFGTDAFTGSLSRVPGEAVGSYVIKKGTLAINSSYNLIFISSVLDITPLPIAETIATINTPTETTPTTAPPVVLGEQTTNTPTNNINGSNQSTDTPKTPDVGFLESTTLNVANWAWLSVTTLIAIAGGSWWWLTRGRRG